MVWGLEHPCDEGRLRELSLVSLEKGKLERISAIHTNISKDGARLCSVVTRSSKL